MEGSHFTNDLTYRKFNFIKNTLFRTMEVYTSQFNELGTLKKVVETSLESQKDLSPISQLEHICCILEEYGVQSYIIRKLHHEATKDLEALKNNRVLNSHKDIYWE